MYMTFLLIKSVMLFAFEQQSSGSPSNFVITITKQELRH